MQLDTFCDTIGTTNISTRSLTKTHSGSKSRWRITSFPAVLVAPGKAIKVGTEKNANTKMNKDERKNGKFGHFVISDFWKYCSDFWGILQFMLSQTNKKILDSLDMNTRKFFVY